MAQSAFDATIMGGSPYFDDFDEAKRFLKVLFRPGRPLPIKRTFSSSKHPSKSN